MKEKETEQEVYDIHIKRKLVEKKALFSLGEKKVKYSL
jgi:hypothetical protein